MAPVDLCIDSTLSVRKSWRSLTPLMRPELSEKVDRILYNFSPQLDLTVRQKYWELDSKIRIEN